MPESVLIKAAFARLFSVNLKELNCGVLVCFVVVIDILGSKKIIIVVGFECCKDVASNL